MLGVSAECEPQKVWATDDTETVGKAPMPDLVAAGAGSRTALIGFIVPAFSRAENLCAVNPELHFTTSETPLIKVPLIKLLLTKLPLTKLRLLEFNNLFGGKLW